MPRNERLRIVYEGHVHEANLGGGRFHFLGMLRALDARDDVDVTAVVPRYDGVPPLDMSGFSGRAVHVSSGRRRGVPGALRYELAKCVLFAWWGLRGLAGRDRPVLLTRVTYHGFSTAVARATGMRVVAEVNGDLVEEAYHRGLGSLAAWAARVLVAIQTGSAHAAVAVTPGIADTVRSPRRPVEVVPNGVDLDRFPPLPTSARHDTPVALFVGTLAPWYEFDVVLDAVAKLAADGWHLAIVGDGEGREHLAAQIRSRGLEGVVHFRGWLSGRDLHDAIRDADVCLVPLVPKGGSSAAGSPLKLFEYLASNRPVVGSDVDGVVEIESPLLVPYRHGDVNSLVGALTAALDVPPLEGEDLREARAQLGWEARADQLVAFVDEVVPARPGGGGVRGVRRQLGERLRATVTVRRPGTRSPGGTPLPPSTLRAAGVHFATDEAYVESAVADVEKVDELTPLGGQRILDYGCGSGRFAVGLIERGTAVDRYCGVDIRAPVIRWADRFLSAHDHRFTFVHLDVRNERYRPGGRPVDELSLAGLPGAPFGVVNMYSVLSHLPSGDVRAVLRALRAAVTPSATIVATAFVEDGAPAETENPEDYSVGEWSGPLHCVRYSREFFEDLLADAGFELARYEHATETDGQSFLVLRPLVAAAEAG